jgi:hypothetical protein
MFIFKIQVLLEMLNFQKQSKEIISRLLINPLNAELNPICHLLALLGAHRILHVSRIRVNLLKPTGFVHQQV